MKRFAEIDFDKYLKAMPTEVFLKDRAGRYIFVNKPQSGWIKPGVDVIGKLDSEVHVDPAMAASCRAEDLQILQTGQCLRTANKAINNGQNVYYEVVKSPVRDDHGDIIGIIGVVIDITEQIKLENKFLDYYQKDVLTGLYNRQYLEKWCKIGSIKLPLAIFVIDCNNLKYFNDTYGHEMGDQLLQLVAQTICDIFPQSHACLSFRMGGDEFAIFCNDTDEKAADRLKERLKNSLQAQKLAGINLSASIGYACMTDPSQKLHCVYAEADNRMYEEKRRYHEGK